MDNKKNKITTSVCDNKNINNRNYKTIDITITIIVVIIVVNKLYIT